MKKVNISVILVLSTIICYGQIDVKIECSTFNELNLNGVPKLLSEKIVSEYLRECPDIPSNLPAISYADQIKYYQKTQECFEIVSAEMTEAIPTLILAKEVSNNANLHAFPILGQNDYTRVFLNHPSPIESSTLIQANINWVTRRLNGAEDSVLIKSIGRDFGTLVSNQMILDTIVTTLKEILQTENQEILKLHNTDLKGFSDEKLKSHYNSLEILTRRTNFMTKMIDSFLSEEVLLMDELLKASKLIDELYEKGSKIHLRLTELHRTASNITTVSDVARVLQMGNNVANKIGLNSNEINDAIAEATIFATDLDFLMETASRIKNGTNQEQLRASGDLLNYLTENKAVGSELAREGVKILAVASELNDVEIKLSKFEESYNTFVSDETSIHKALDFANQSIVIAQSAHSALTILGVKSEEMNEAAELISYASTVVNFAGSIATGNYFGAITQGLGAFGSSDDGPSKEEQMIEAMWASMNAQFKYLNEKNQINHEEVMNGIITVNDNINSVKDLISKVYEGINLSITKLATYQDSRFDKLDKSLELLQIASHYLIIKKYESEFNLLDETLRNNNLSYSKLWAQIGPSHRKDIVKVIPTLSLGESLPIAMALAKTLEEPPTGDTVHAIISSGTVDDLIAQYENIKSLFTTTYQNSNSHVLIATLLYPSLKTEDNSRFFNMHSGAPSIPLESINDYLGEMLNHALILQLSSLYSELLPIYLTEQGQGYNKTPINDLNAHFESEVYEVFLSDAEPRCEKLIEYLDRSIAQQSLLNGSMILNRIDYNLNPSYPVNESERLKSERALKSNPYLMANFAIHFINKKLRDSEISKLESISEFETLYRDILASRLNVPEDASSMEIYGVLVPIPTAQSVYYQQKYLPEILIELSEQRRIMVDILFEIKMSKTLLAKEYHLEINKSIKKNEMVRAIVSSQEN